MERLKLDADGMHVMYSFVLEDPEYPAEPIGGSEIAWAHRPDLEFATVAGDPEIACVTVE